MKRLFLLLALTAASAPAFAQDYETAAVDTFVTSTGYKYWKGKTVRLGTGSMPDGDFKYIRISATSMFQYTGTDRSGVNAANSLPGGNGGLTYEIIRVDHRGTKKHGYINYAIINTGMTRFQIEVERAIAAGELDVPVQFLPASKQPQQPVVAPLSVADELAKLKKLLDEGTITQADYDQAKAKLLN